MAFYQTNELDDLGEDHQEPGGNQELSDAQIFGAHEEELPSFSPPSPSSPIVLFPDNPEEVAAVAPSPPRSPESSCPAPSALEAIPLSQSAGEGSSSQDEAGPSTAEVPEDVLRFKMARLLFFLLTKYRAKEPTSKAEMLSNIITEHQDHFNEIFSSTSQRLQLVFGVDVTEVDPINHIYVLGATLGLTYDQMANDGHSMPKTGLLILLLSIISLEGGCASEEKVWKVINDVGVYEGYDHFVYGEPRELITKVWVEEQYLVYRQVADSDPALYEFLWGPRAHAETTELKVLELFLKHIATYAPSQSQEAKSDEEEGA